MTNATILAYANRQTHQSSTHAFEATFFAGASRGGSGAMASSLKKASASLYSASSKNQGADRDSRAQDGFYREAFRRVDRSSTTIGAIDRRIAEPDCDASVGGLLATRRAWRIGPGTSSWNIVSTVWVMRSWPKRIGPWFPKEKGLGS